MTDNHIFPFLWMRGEPEEVLRTELAKIYEAGIRSVCLEARPHPDYAGEGWWHDVDIVIDEAKKRGMTIWILDDAHFPTGMANGGMAKHPDKVRRFLITDYTDITGPKAAAQLEIGEFTKKKFSFADLGGGPPMGGPKAPPRKEETKILSVTATRVVHGDVEEGEAMDLTDCVENGILTADFPDGVWRVHVNFVSTAFDPKPEYINYIEKDSVRVLIDEVYEKHYARYKDLFGTVISGFFSDEPGFYSTEMYGPGHVGTKTNLPWGKELEEELLKTYGDNLYRDLAMLFANHDDDSHRGIRMAYMDIVSRLYGKNFTSQLGDWCRAHGVEYIGHLVEERDTYMQLGAGAGHYFRGMLGQSMAGIDNIGCQVEPGKDLVYRQFYFPDQDADFYHYYLGKLGGSAAAIDPKKGGRLMCENFGAYGWRLGVRDMKWLVDYLIGQGVNYFVPHAFSMAEYPDEDCPPHFYARGNNPQFPYFCTLMGYTDRLCKLFSGGKNVPQVATLFEAEAHWSGETMRGKVVGRELISHQIDFEIIPSDVFADAAYYGCKVEDGKLIVNERSMKVLVVPACDYIPEVAARFIAANPQLPVVYVDRFPKGISELVADGDSLLASAIAGKKVVPLAELSATLRTMGVDDNITVEGAGYNLHQYHYTKDGREIYQLMNVSTGETMNLKLQLPKAGSYGVYDAFTDTTYALETVDGACDMTIVPYQSVIIITDPEATVPARKIGSCIGSIPMETFDVVLHGIGKDEPEVLKDFTLKPISSIDFNFSGTIEYSTTVTLDTLPACAKFSAEHVYECMTLTVNGKTLDRVLHMPYEQEITEALKVGENTITVSVATTPARHANANPKGPFGKDRIFLEPTGMFGAVALKLYEA